MQQRGRAGALRRPDAAAQRPYPYQFVSQTSGHFSREREIVSVRHYRYFLTISQQKPGKRYFGKKKFLKISQNLATHLPII